MRIHRLGLPLLALLLADGGEVQGQSQRTHTLLSGSGYTEHSGGLTPSLHVAGRRLLLRWDSVPYFYPDVHAPVMLRNLQIHTEASYQRVLARPNLRECRLTSRSRCEGDLTLVGAGLTTTWGANPARHPVQLYFVPGSVGFYLRVMETESLPPAEALTSSVVAREADRSAAVGFAVGNGAGLRFRLAERDVLVEVRPTLVYFLDGERRGSMPIGIGFTF